MLGSSGTRSFAAVSNEIISGCNGAITDRSLDARCSFCDDRGWQLHAASEMMLGLRHRFKYRECRNCGALFLVDVPDDFAPYYPTTYYSYTAPIERLGRAKRLFYRLHIAAPEFMRRVRPCGAPLAAFAACRLQTGARVLDVGSGNGELVAALRSLGFDAMGIDPFIADDLYDERGIRVRRCSVEQIDGSWDLIMFHHSLEHIADHLTVLHAVRGKLTSRGICMVRIPVAAWAWRHYGVNWVQLDAPRHLVIHTARSFQLLAQKAGFSICGIEFDSRDLQFWGSELYRRDIPLLSDGSLTAGRSFFSKDEIAAFQRRAVELNKNKDGDQATFFLTVDDTARQFDRQTSAHDQ